MDVVGRVVGSALAFALLLAPGLARAADATAAPLQRPRSMLASPTSPAASAAPTPEPVASPTPREIPPAQPVAAAPVAAEPVAAAPVAADTTTPSPPSPRTAARASDPGELGVRRSARTPPRKYAHDGFTTDLRIGTLGCLRGLCGSGHNVSPGFRIDGFVGGNIRGFVDFGLAGGWGTMGSDVAPGTNVLSLYGLDPFLLQQALGLLGGAALGFDLTTLNVTDTKLRAAQAGPLLRVHFIPRGRFSAYVGSGVQYNLFRARYATAVGGARMDFHGLAVPIEAGFGVYVHEHVSVGVQFDYLWTWYALANLDHAGQSLTVPVRILDEAARMQNASVKGQLPQFWTFALALRARI